MIKKIVVFSAITWICGLTDLQAGVITYTESAVGSGTLGSQSFSSELVTVSLTADTSGITDVGPYYTTLPATTTVTIAGIGTAAFTDSVYLLNDPFDGTVQFFDFTGTGYTAILGTTAAALVGYDLGSAIGPFTGSAFNGGSSLPTTLGTFYLELGDSESGTFTATGQSVPEPASIAMLGMAILIIAGHRAHRKIA
jgi:hypothetical protein